MRPRSELNPGELRTVSSRWPWLRVALLELRDGHRSAPEAAVLADLLAQQPRRFGHILDLGAGNGVLGLIAAAAAGSPAAVVTLVEQNAAAAQLAAVNAATVGTAHNIRAHARVGDIRTLTTGDVDAPPDLIVTNPPWFEPGSGRASSNPAAHAATHALAGDYAAFIDVAARLRAPGGVVWLLAPADHLADVLATLDPDKIAPQQLVLVWGRHRTRPLRVWIALGDPGSVAVHTHVCCYTAR